MLKETITRIPRVSPSDSGTILVDWIGLRKKFRFHSGVDTHFRAELTGMNGDVFTVTILAGFFRDDGRIHLKDIWDNHYYLQAVEPDAYALWFNDDLNGFAKEPGPKRHARKHRKQPEQVDDPEACQSSGVSKPEVG